MSTACIIEGMLIDDISLKEIAGAPGYFVTKEGSAYTCWRGGSYKRRTRRVRRLKGSKHVINNAITVSIKGKRIYLGRLILQAFVGPCPNGMECCHNDGNPANNHVDNLRWDTRKNNVADTIKHGRHPCGESSGQAKLTDAKVRKARQFRREGKLHQEIADILGVSRTAITVLLGGKTWKHLID